MTAYWILLLLPFVGLLMPVRLARAPWQLAWFGMAAVAALAIGFRHQIGGDWDGYVAIYEGFAAAPLNEVASASGDPGYSVLNWLSGQLGWGIYGVNLACAAIFVGGFSVFAARQPMRWLAWIVCIPYLLIVVAMGYSRQGVALGLVFLALASLEDSRIWRFAVLIAIAGLFHKTAILLMPLGFLSRKNLGWTNVVALSLALAAAAAGLLFTYLEVFWENYVQTNLSSEGGAVRVWMNAVPAMLMLLCGRVWQRRWPDPGHWRYIAWGSIACIFLVGLASTAVDRAALYLAPLQVYVWCRVPLLFRDRPQRTAVAIAIGITYAMVLGVWLTFGIHAQYWLPYRNVLFG
jgi:hypothetical protein